MKSILLFLTGVYFGICAQAQVGINTTTPAATLDIVAKDTPDEKDGLLLPRLDQFPLTNPGIEQDGMLIFITGNAADERGFYFWDYDITTPKWNSISGSKDIDWYKTGTTNAPGEIEDNLYTKGTLSINSSLTNNAITIENGYADVDAFIMNKVTGSDTSLQTIGLHNDFEGAPDSNIRAVKNTFSTTTNKNQYGLDNTFASTGTNSLRVGVNNTFNEGGGVVMGVQNVFPASNTNSSIVRGLFNNILTAADGTHYGVQNILDGDSNAAKYGVHTELTGTGNGIQYGTYNILNGSGSGSKYGVYSKIEPSTGGIHYAIYGQATNTSGYAGYFVGKINIGQGFTNRYSLPEEDGTANQVLMTDGEGNTAWRNIPALLAPTLVTTPIVCNVLLSNDQEIQANEYQKLNFNTIDFDTNGNFTNEINAFVVPQNGYYRVQVSFKGQTLNHQYAHIQLALYKNGQIIEERFIENSVLISGVLQTTTSLTTGDRLEVFISPNNQITVSNLAHQTSFKIEKL